MQHPESILTSAGNSPISEQWTTLSKRMIHIKGVERAVIGLRDGVIGRPEAKLVALSTQPRRGPKKVCKNPDTLS